jgi:hypothetical protein
MYIVLLIRSFLRRALPNQSCNFVQSAKRCARVLINRALYLVGPGFKSQSRGPTVLTVGFSGLLSLSRKIPGLCLK